MTTIESKTRRSAASWSFASRCASQARQELDRAVAERLAQALVESDRLLLPRFPDRSSPMENRCLEQHLECVIQQDQDGIDAAPVPGPVEVLDAEHERVDRLREEQSRFALHRGVSLLGRHGPPGGPGPFVRGAALHVLQQWKKERAQHAREIARRIAADGDPRAAGEGTHLGRARGVVPVHRREPDRLFGGDGRVPALEGPAYGLGEGRAIEFEAAREMVQVEEVLDAAVSVAEYDHGLEFFRHHGLARVGEQLGRGKVEQRRVGAGLRRGPDGVAKPHVDLQREARFPAPGGQCGARAGVFVFSADRLDADALAVEADGVGRNGRRDDRTQVLADRIEGAVTPAKQIEVARRPVGPVRPEPQQHGALEHEALAAIGHAEAVQEALEAVACQQGLVVFAGRLFPVEQARGNGRGEVGLAGHAIASR